MGGTEEVLLDLRDVVAAGRQASVEWGVGRHRLSTDVWYQSVVLEDLQRASGEEWLQRWLLHVAMFEIDKGVSLRPDRLVLPQSLEADLTPDLAELWQRVVHGVFGQWRYENSEPDYRGPRLPAGGARGPARTPAAAAGTASGGERPDGVLRPLVFCGGGKDSLVAATLFDRLGVEYETLAYSHSVYGPPAPQHRLIDSLLDRCGGGRRHRFDVVDTMLSLPVHLLDDVYRPAQLIAGETPASVFEALPVALSHGRTDLVVAHERSANTGNLVWGETGEEVNHQWGKSRSAEVLLDEYLRRHLLPDQPVRYWSILAEVHDPVIFSMLRERIDAVPFTHSCNVEKPWCLRCPKCAYVWLGYAAWLPREVVEGMFGGCNLLEVPENLAWYRQMLGLGDHTPFECIGRVEEVRLHFAMCRARGFDGAAMTVFEEELPEEDWMRAADASLAVHPEDSRAPAAIAPPLTALLAKAAADARQTVEELLA